MSCGEPERGAGSDFAVDRRETEPGGLLLDGPGIDRRCPGCGRGLPGKN
jgi:hypothetical protein